MKKILITSYVLIALLIAGLTFSLIRINSLQLEVNDLKYLTNNAIDVADKVEKLDKSKSKENSDLSKRIDDVEDDLTLIKRFAGWELNISSSLTTTRTRTFK